MLAFINFHCSEQIDSFSTQSFLHLLLYFYGLITLLKKYNYHWHILYLNAFLPNNLRYKKSHAAPIICVGVVRDLESSLSKPINIPKSHTPLFSRGAVILVPGPLSPKPSTQKALFVLFYSFFLTLGISSLWIS